MSAKAKSQMYSSLEKYARSGMGMEKACESLLQQPRVSRTERSIYRGVLSGLNAGRSIGESFGRASGAISALEEEVIAASEMGGMLEKGFGHLAEYFRRMDRTRRRILKGLTYPLVLIHLAVPVFTLVGTAFRNFSSALSGTGDSGGYDEAFLDAGRNMLAAYAMIVVLVLIIRFLMKAARTSPSADAFLGRIPLVGKARKAIALERFTKVFEIFLLAGKKISDSLEGAGKASGSGLLLEASGRGARMVANGDPLSVALYSVPSAIPNDFARGMDAAEQSGQLDRELAEWAQLYSDSAHEMMERVAEWAPKLFYWAILILVGWMAIRAAQSYFGIFNSVDSSFY